MSSDSDDETPTLSGIIRTQIGRVLDGMHTCMPGRVTSYDAASQEASVQPLFKGTRRADGGEPIVEALPVINHVPVVFPGAGAYSITFPVSKGDTVLLVFAEQSLDKWLVNDGIVDPQSTRRFHISDAIAIPGLRSFRNPIEDVPTDALVITGDSIKLGSKNASDPVALKSDLDAFASGIDVRIAALTPGLPGTATEINTLTAIKDALPIGWPTCSQKVEAE